MMQYLRLPLITAVLILVASLVIARHWFFSVAPVSLQLLPGPMRVPAFELSSARDHHFTEQELKGQWSLLFFGYSHCVDICPMELQIFNQVLAKTPENLQTIFVGLDPDRDSIETLRGFTASVNRNIKAVTGTHQALAKLMRGFGVGCSRDLAARDAIAAIPVDGSPVNESPVNGSPVNGSPVNGSPVNGSPADRTSVDGTPQSVAQDYSLIHSNRIFLVDPQGNYVGSFPAPHDAEKISSDLQMIIKR